MRVGVNGLLLSSRPGYRRSGIGRYLEGLLAGLPAALAPGDDVVVAAPGDAAAWPGLESGWRPAPGRLAMERPLLRAAWEQTALPIAAWRDRVDVLHGPVNVVPLLAPCPTIVTVHDLAFLRRPDLLPAGRRRYFGAMLRASLRRAARVIAVSERTKADLVELLGVAPARIAVTPLAADAGFRPASEEMLAAFRTAEQLERPYALYVGNLEPRKNLPTLLCAFAAIAAEVPHDLVLVGGAGWMTTKIFATHERLKLGDRVRFAGYAGQDALPLWYGAADLFVFPSLYEGFGLPPLEAMACGTPVVTATGSSLPEVVGDAALLVDPRDTDALAEAMRRVLTDRMLAADLRARGLARAARFSWARTVEQTVRVYREVLA